MRNDKKAHAVFPAWAFFVMIWHRRNAVCFTSRPPQFCVKMGYEAATFGKKTGSYWRIRKPLSESLRQIRIKRDFNRHRGR